MFKSGISFINRRKQASASSSSTQVSLSVGGCRQTQNELDLLAAKVQKEALNAERSSMRLEQLARAVQAEKLAFETKLVSLLKQSGVQLDQPLCFCVYKGELKLTDPQHPQASRIHYVLAQSPTITDEFIHLEQHLRAIEIGRMATSAYGHWKRKGDVVSAQNLTRTTVSRLQHMSGARLQNGQLSLLLEGQSQRQLSFYRKFDFSV